MKVERPRFQVSLLSAFQFPLSPSTSPFNLSLHTLTYIYTINNYTRKKNTITQNKHIWLRRRNSSRSRNRLHHHLHRKPNLSLLLLPPVQSYRYRRRTRTGSGACCLTPAATILLLLRWLSTTLSPKLKRRGGFALFTRSSLAKVSLMITLNKLYLLSRFFFLILDKRIYLGTRVENSDFYFL